MLEVTHLPRISEVSRLMWGILCCFTTFLIYHSFLFIPFHKFRYYPGMSLMLILINLAQKYIHVSWSPKIKTLQFRLQLTGGNWQKWKRAFLTCPCHEIYRDEAVGLKSCKKYLKNYNICENVKFGAISRKFDILSITA